ncbi:MAG TPA: hypothetical protein VJ023_14355 [Pyrinomonadaceae bacterium]|nr:hypothetical protein [Pyrinomonadaceae bacterium]
MENTLTSEPDVEAAWSEEIERLLVEIDAGHSEIDPMGGSSSGITGPV